MCGKKMLIVGWLEGDELFLQELFAKAKLLGFEVETFLWQHSHRPTSYSNIYIKQDPDVIVVSGLGCEQWWAKALNAQSAPVVYNNWLALTENQELDLTVRHLEIVGSNVENVLRGAQQLTA